MSCPQEPTTEDVEFRCTAKGTGRDDRCIYYFWIPKDKATVAESVCESSQTINGVIQKLESLLADEPWMGEEGTNDGVIHETEQLEAMEGNKDDDSEDLEVGDGLWPAQREEFRREMEESFVATGGQGLTEEEAWGLESHSEVTALAVKSSFQACWGLSSRAE